MHGPLAPAARAGAFAAMLFDLDGTLIDSMPLHQAAWRQWHARLGLPFDEDRFFAETAGRTNDEILRDRLPTLGGAERARLAEAKEALYREQAARSLAMVPGFEALRDEARRHGAKLAICTAAPPANLRLALDRFGLDAQVDAVLSPADRVGSDGPLDGPFAGLVPGAPLRGKPHPDIFLEAARRLGVAPGGCLVFEDAPLGVEAARRAGMRAVALTTTLPAASFAAFDHLVATLPDLRGFVPPSALSSRKENHHA